MEETLAGVTAELERVVRPLGFKIESVKRIGKREPLIEGTFKERSDDTEKLDIHIIRKGELG
jgi:hypothetical protein